MTFGSLGPRAPGPVRRHRRSLIARQRPVRQRQQNYQETRVGISGPPGQNPTEILGGHPDHREHHDGQDHTGPGNAGRRGRRRPQRGRRRRAQWLQPCRDGERTIHWRHRCGPANPVPPCSFPRRGRAARGATVRTRRATVGPTGPRWSPIWPSRRAPRRHGRRRTADRNTPAATARWRAGRRRARPPDLRRTGAPPEKTRPRPSPNHQTASDQTTERASAGLSVARGNDPESDKELDQGERCVGRHGVVVDDRGVPGDRAGDPAGVAARQSVQHCAESVRPRREHEGL